MMTFKERHVEKLEENYDSYGNGNRNKYLTGALGGAGITAGAHMLGNSKVGEGNLDIAKDYWQKNEVWNDAMDKGQDLFGWLKSDGGGGEAAKSATQSVSDKLESVANSI